MKPIGLVVLNHQKYAVPGYHKVPRETTIQDLSAMTFDIPEEKPVSRELITHEEEVLSSNGKSHYTVKFKGLYWSCTCAGYGFRRRCRHIEQVKKTVNF